MTTYLVSRHQGAIDWCQQQDIKIDQHLTHFDAKLTQAGDTIIGNLPLQIAAQVCAAGAHYLHLEVNIPYELRGQELTSAQLQQFGAKLTEFTIQKVFTTVK